MKMIIQLIQLNFNLNFKYNKIGHLYTREADTMRWLTGKKES